MILVATACQKGRLAAKRQRMRRQWCWTEALNADDLRRFAAKTAVSVAPPRDAAPRRPATAAGIGVTAHARSVPSRSSRSISVGAPAVYREPGGVPPAEPAAGKPRRFLPCHLPCVSPGRSAEPGQAIMVVQLPACVTVGHGDHGPSSTMPDGQLSCGRTQLLAVHPPRFRLAGRASPARHPALAAGQRRPLRSRVLLGHPTSAAPHACAGSAAAAAPC